MFNLKKHGKFILILVLSLFITTGSVFAMYMPANKSISPKMAKEYGTWIEDLEIFFGFVDESKQSFYSFDEENSDDYTGLLYGELIDFDNDGSLELLTIFNQAGDYNNVNSVVLGFDGNNFFELHNNADLSDQDPDWDIERRLPFVGVSANMGEMGTTKVGDKTYLYYKNEDGTGQEFWLTHDYFTLKNGKWIRDTSLEYTKETEYDSKDKETETISYKQNGKIINEAEYKKILAAFEKNKKIILTDYEDIGRPIKFDGYEFLNFLNEKANSTYIPKKESFAAKPTYSKVMVNNENVYFEAYNINDNNYFKLRDLAHALNGSDKQFEVLWNDYLKSIELFTNQPYTIVGGEMILGNGKVKDAIVNKSKIYINSKEETLSAYTINDNNYFKLRDIGQAFNFGVDWDGVNNTIRINTKKPYVKE